MHRRFVPIAAAVAILAALAVVPARAQFPYPGSGGGDVYDYTRLHIRDGRCMPLAPAQKVPPTSDLPPGFDCRETTKLTDYAAQPGDADYDPAVANNPQELFGVKGAGTNRAWELTTGRPDTIIAVMDSGIEWNTPELVNKVHLNSGELPVPCTSSPCTTTHSSNWKDYDVNHDGVFNMVDYARDPRLHPQNGTYLTGQDLVRTFSDAQDGDGNGYVDDIAGWDFYQADNDASDDVTYGHGTGEAKDSSAEIGKAITQCPNCMFLPLRVGDSFIADINHWAEAVVYAVDNAASVVQEALGTLNHTGFAQVAADYAYRNGVLIVASEADESAGHHNYPAALNHTMVVNSVTHFAEEGGVALQSPKTYLAFNGCTNFGGYTWVSVSSNSCSSDATGQSSGIAGLLYSAARNVGVRLSAEEAKQLFRLAADDIDFSTPRAPGPPNNFATTLPASMRFVTTAGWDQISGFGRLSANKLVRLVTAKSIPPEADVVSPRWWQTLGTSGSVDVVGRVAAPRASSYTYEVEVAPGVQPPRWPLSDTWTTVASGAGTEPRDGVLARLNMAKVRALIDAAPPAYTPADDPTSRDLPEKDAFRVRVVVHADGSDDPTKTAIEQRQYFSHADPDLVPGFPAYLNADGAGSPAFADIDGDGVSELVLADGNGFVHAFHEDGTEAEGWPTHTTRLALPRSGDNAFTKGAVSSKVYAPVLLGSPAIADLDADGWPEISVADIEGRLWVWDHAGRVRRGFPVRTRKEFSEVPGCQTAIGPACDEFSPHPVRDHVNTVDHAFTSAPVAAHLERDGSLALVAGANDGHVYAWRADGTPVPGWPVMLRDPAKVAAVDPVSHRVTFKPDAKPFYGRQILASASAADVDHDGLDEIAVNVDEEYDESPNWSLRDPSLGLVGQVAGPGNTRTYLLHPDGTRHAGTERVANLGDNAYVKGWPVKIGMLQAELLPDVGSGSNGAPTFADVDGDGTLEIGTASIASPPYLLKLDGSSYYGNGPDGKYVTMASLPSEFKNPTATDGPSVASLGGGVFGRLGGAGSPYSWAMGASGLRRLLDVVLPEQQLGPEDHLGVWDARTGTYEPGFPAQMNDLMFFNTPAVIDVDGDGRSEVLQSSAMYDFRAYGLGGLVPGGWPKFTGGWGVSTAGAGDFTGDGTLVVATNTREGDLFVWRTTGSPCAPGDWPKFQHDLRNTGTAGVDATPPAVVRDVRAVRHGSPVDVTWSPTGDDGRCGRAAGYLVRAGKGAPVRLGPDASSASLVTTAATVVVQAIDDAGNLGIPVTVRVS